MDFLLLSCLGFAITAHAQDCARPAEGPNMHLKDEYILNDTFSDGDQAAFECDVGYVSAGGSSSITCTAGSWSAVMLKCERKNCGSPGEVKHGHIHYPKENLFGDYIEITCDEGYILVGKPAVVCGAAGWLGRLPRCEAVICHDAPQVKDATFTPYKDPYDFGDAVQYRCQNGLTLNGSESISCSGDGTFKPDPPTCTRVQCEDLDIPNLIWRSGSQPPHGYKATVTYKCRTGFRMIGHPTLTCEINSTWSPEHPRCEMVTCNPPQLVVSGSFSPVKEVYNYGDNVQYSCKTDFRLIGSNSASCSDDGTFKPAPPTCTLINCEEPHVEHGYLTDGARPPYRPNDKVTFKCRLFYYMDGESTLTCEAGLWSPQPPKCTYSHGKVAGAVIGGGTAGAGLIYTALVYFGIVPPPGRKRSSDEEDTNAEQKKSLLDDMGLEDQPISNGQTSEEEYSVPSREKRFVEEIAPEAEEEVALLDDVGLKQSPAGNGQTSGEGHRGQVARKRVNHVGQK